MGFGSVKRYIKQSIALFGEIWQLFAQLMSEQIPEDARKDFEALVQFLIPFAEQMLRENGEFYPFAAMMTTESEVVPFEPEVDSEMPDPNLVLVKIAAAFQEEAKEGRIRAAGSCHNASVGEERQDAVILMLEHVTEGAVKGYVTYKKGLFGKYRFGELTMGRGDAKIFVREGRQ